MKLVPLDSSWESTFWNLVLNSVPNYYFFLFDWRLNKDKTAILLALQDGDIAGSMLIYDQRIVHIRGSSEAADLLMREVDLDKAEFLVPMEHEAIILKKYHLSTWNEMILMTLHRGHEKLYVKHSVMKLGSLEAEEIADLLGEEFPEWGEFTGGSYHRAYERGCSFLGHQGEWRGCFVG